MNGGAERIDGSNGSYENPWDSLAEVKFKGADKKEATTVGSTVENAVERAGGDFSNFIAGFQERMAKNRQGRLNDKLEDKAATKADAEKKLEDAIANVDGANNTLEEAILNVREVKNGIAENKDNISTLTKETRIGNQIKTQVKQVGEVVKAGGEVLKAGLNKFKTEILASIKLPKIKFESARDVARRNWNEQIKELSEERTEAKKVDNASEKAGKDFSKAKETFEKKFNGFGENRQNRKDKLESLKKEREDLKMNKELLSMAKKESREAQLAVSEAEASRTKAGKEFAAAISAFAKAEVRKNEADARVTEISGKIKTQENIIKFQEELGSMSPAKLREQLENRREEILQNRQRTINLCLIMAGVEDMDELDDKRKKGLEKFLNEDGLAGVEENLSALDTYENYRRKQASNIVKFSAYQKAAREIHAA